jgi:hypothetical protein
MANRVSLSRSKFLAYDHLSRIAILGDPQHWSDSRWPSQGRPIEQAQVSWILANRVARKIEAVLVTGDIVNDCTSKESYANSYADIVAPLIAADMPVVLCAGNHDTPGTRVLENFNAVGSVTGYGLGDLTPRMTYLKEPGKLENSGLLTTLSGRTTLFISLEFSPRDATVEWAESIIQANPGVLTVLLTHAFMWREGTVYARPPAEGELWNPIAYNVTPSEGINTGVDLVAKLIDPYPQVKLAVCGHAFPGHSHGTWTRADGTKWHGTQHDYQDHEDYSVDWRGHMYELTLDFNNDAIIGWAFSPLTNTEWPETLSSENSRYNNVHIANAGIR